jgi:hypothetical protein
MLRIGTAGRTSLSVGNPSRRNGLESFERCSQKIPKLTSKKDAGVCISGVFVLHVKSCYGQGTADAVSAVSFG